ASSRRVRRRGPATGLRPDPTTAEAEAAIRARTQTVKPGEFITAMGGFTPAQFAENRLPTLAELDAAAPNHPVLVFNSFTGPSTTNSLARSFFASKRIVVDPAAHITANATS